MTKLDENHLTALVLEVFPDHSCLVFYDSRNRCESVAELLAKIMFNMQDVRDKVKGHRREEKQVGGVQGPD